MKNNERILIGKGRISSIYSDGFYAYKRYPDDYELAWIENEVKIQNEIANHTNLPVIKYELIESNKEIKMEMIQGITLRERMQKQGYKDGLKDLISIQKSIHQFTNLNLPKAKDVFERRIKASNIDQSLKEKALKSLHLVEDKTNLCHFDLHFENIMYEDKKTYIIDWPDAKLASPILDITRSYIIMLEFVPSIAKKYLKSVEENFNVKVTEMNQILSCIAAIRLTETNDKNFKNILKDMINGKLQLTIK